MIIVGGRSAKQAMLNWALRLSSQGAKKDWPCKKIEVYSCENGLCVCVCAYFFSCICFMYSRKGNGCVCVCVGVCGPCFQVMKWSSVHVCLFVLHVCASKCVIYDGKLDIIALVCAKHACTCIQGNGYIYVCVCVLCVWIMFSDVCIILSLAVFNLLIKWEREQALPLESYCLSFHQNYYLRVWIFWFIAAFRVL